MPWKACVLVVANRTADSDELLEALRTRAERGSVKFTLLVPATQFSGRPTDEAGKAGARRQLESALERMGDAGLEVVGDVGDADPMAAIADIWDPGAYDEIIVSTLPTGASRWLAVDLPRRVSRITGTTVAHVVSHERRPEPAVSSEPPKKRDWTANFKLKPREQRGA
jgi:hypothetical protein